jgi:tol-pal system protein YbgF
MRQPGKAILWVALGAAFALPTSAGELERRVERLERTLENQNLADVILQMQRLQQEVQELRGQLEVQTHRLEAQSQRQRDLYLDLDQRLNQLGDGAVPPPEERPVLLDADAEADTPVESQPAGDPAKEEADYQQAFELLKERRYPEAITAFEALRQQYPGGRYADNAQYWLAEAHYVTRDFERAQAEFEALLSRYPDSAKVPGALLKLGYIRYEQQQWGEARKLLERLQREYPGSTEARLAAARLDKMRQEGR